MGVAGRPRARMAGGVRGRNSGGSPGGECRDVLGHGFVALQQPAVSRYRPDRLDSEPGRAHRTAEHRDNSTAVRRLAGADRRLRRRRRLHAQDRVPDGKRKERTNFDLGLHDRHAGCAWRSAALGPHIRPGRPGGCRTLCGADSRRPRARAIRIAAGRVGPAPRSDRPAARRRRRACRTNLRSQANRSASGGRSRPATLSPAAMDRQPSRGSRRKCQIEDGLARVDRTRAHGWQDGRPFDVHRGGSTRTSGRRRRPNGARSFSCCSVRRSAC